MDLAFKRAAILVLLVNVSFSYSVIQGKDDYEHCRSVVQNWASSSLDLKPREDKHTLKELLVFLHIPRTGGKSYFYCLLNKLYSKNQQCPWSYDKLQIDPSIPNCSLLGSHDDYSMISKLQREKKSVVTILRNPIDRVFSTYEFSVQIAARFLAYPNLTAAMGSTVRLQTTFDIWPWKYLSPWMTEDLFSRREARNGKVPTYMPNNDSYNMADIAMPFHEYINDPIARDIVHNGATFQIAGLTNNSYEPDAHEVRHCVLNHQTLGDHVLKVAKLRLDNMLFVGLTEYQKESAKMFADMVGSQMISQSIRRNPIKKLAVHDTSGKSSSSLVSESETSNQNGSIGQKSNKVPSENVEATSKNMNVGKIIKGYEACIRSMRIAQEKLYVASIKRISPVNFTKEARLRVPEVVIEKIRSLNSLDIQLYAYGMDIFLKQHRQMMLKLEIAEQKKSISSNTPLWNKMKEKQEIIYRDLYDYLSRDILWSTIPVVSFLLAIVVCLKARRRAIKVKL